MSQPERVGMGVRAALHALDAALAEHRRALALAAGRRETERMARGRDVRAAGLAAAAALEQPVERPMRALRLAETWVEVDRARHPLTPGVRAAVAGGELRVQGEDWSGRLVVAPGEGPAAAAAGAAARIEAAAPLARARARSRLDRVIAASGAHAAACLGLAAALAAADRDAGERHADRGRLDECVADLAGRLGPQALVEPAELAAARERLALARAHLDGVPAQPYAWLAEWPPAIAGAMLRDVPTERLEPVRGALGRLAEAAGGAEPLLALAAGAEVVAAVTPSRVLIAGAEVARAHAPAAVEAAGGALLVGGVEAVARLDELEPGRFAAVLELVTAAAPDAGPAGSQPVPPDAGELLEKLGDLRDAGVLTADEFAAKQAELLRRT